MHRPVGACMLGMEMRRRSGPCALVLLALVVVGCGGGDPSWPVTATTTSAPLATLAAGPGGFVLTVKSGSKAVVRVREQLASVVTGSEAVLTTDSVSGRVAIKRDGSFVPGSRIVVLLDDLRSDNAQRDRFVKEQTLRTREFPTAEFIPTRATGLSLPLRMDGQVVFRLAGTMTLHGVAKEVAFDVKAARVGSEIIATATNAPAWKFADFGLQIPRVLSVLSIVDDIRLEVQLVATEGPGR